MPHRLLAPALIMLLVPALAAAGGTADFSKMTPDYLVDVCVLGGGPSGVAAAVSAARNGANVLLVEQYGFLGGTMTASSVNVFMTYRFAGGLVREVLNRLAAVGGRKGSTYDVNQMQVILDQMTAEAGVHVLLYTRAIGAVTAPGKSWQGKPRKTISGLVIHNKSGLQMVCAKTFVDCSGDAELATWAGVPSDIGREEDGLTQPMTMMFRMGGCTFKGGNLRSFPGMADYWVSYYWNPNPGEITLNMTRIKGYLGVNGEQLTAATVDGRREVLTAVETLRKNVPGFEDAYLLAMPAQIGVRETRRIHGATTLTGEQIVNPRFTYARRHDVIGRNNYDVDIHDPTGTNAQIIRLKQPYEIPYRCLLPQGVDNLLVAGRPISADHVAHSSLRIQPTCFVLGQAAGTAAALAARHGCGPWEVGQLDDPLGGQPYLEELQRLLITQGADLGEERAVELGLETEWRRWQLSFALAVNPVLTDFADVPKGHAAYDAVMGLARMGLLQGYGDGRYGAADLASRGVVCTVIARALAALPTAERVPAPAELPARLKGQFWSPAVAELAGRGILPPGSLETFDPEAPVSPEDLRALLQSTFGTAQLPDLAPGLLSGGNVTRVALAQWLWACLQPK
jgi:hypothetical protein